jgi:hypothetical protein
VELGACDDEALDALVGFVRGRAAWFVRALERSPPADGLGLRPYSMPRHASFARGANGVAAASFSIGLDAPWSVRPSLAPEPLRELARAVEAWEQRPAMTAVRIFVESSAEAGVSRPARG